jgi:arylsulfatase A-like enzyme
MITSDHGENFGEHGLAVHPLCVYDSLLHVPLIVSYPHLIPKGKRIANIVSTIDIFPTVMDVSNIKFENSIQGKSLYPFEDRKIHDFICAEYGGLFMRGLGGWKGKRPSGFKNKLGVIDKSRKCIRTLNYKYILTKGEEELYNVRDDPYEQRNIVAEYPKMAKSLRIQLEKTVDISYFGPEEFPQANEKDREMLKRLKTLGYF